MKGPSPSQIQKTISKQSVVITETNDSSELSNASPNKSFIIDENESSNESSTSHENESSFAPVSSTFLTEIDSGDEIRKEKKKSKCENIPLNPPMGLLPVRPDLPPKPTKYSKKLKSTKTNSVSLSDEVGLGNQGRSLGSSGVTTGHVSSDASEHEQEISAALNQLKLDLLNQSESRINGQSDFIIFGQSESLIQPDPAENVSTEFNNSNPKIDQKVEQKIEEKVEEPVEPPAKVESVELKVEPEVQGEVEPAVEAPVMTKTEVIEAPDVSEAETIVKTHDTVFIIN